MLQDHSNNRTIDKAGTEFFKKNGFLVRDKYFSNEQVSLLKKHTKKFLSEFNKSNTIEEEDFLYEDSSSTLRLVRNVHKKNGFFRELALGKDLMSLAQQLSSSNPTLLNTKLNFKNAFTGEQFDWHQDSIYLGEEYKNSIAFIIAVDDVTHQNGPMMVIPRSHENGIINVPHRDKMSDDDRKQYPHTRTLNLPFSLPNNLIEEGYNSHGIESFVGKAGTLFAMHCSLFHCSNLNLSPTNRASFLIRYGCG